MNVNNNRLKIIKNRIDLIWIKLDNDIENIIKFVTNCIDEEITSIVHLIESYINEVTSVNTDIIHRINNPVDTLLDDGINLNRFLDFMINNHLCIINRDLDGIQINDYPCIIDRSLDKIQIIKEVIDNIDSIYPIHNNRYSKIVHIYKLINLFKNEER